jgi:hypothetical protein
MITDTTMPSGVSFDTVMDKLADNLNAMGANPEMLDTLIEAIEFVLKHPSQYRAVLAKAIMEGLIDDGDLPPTFDRNLMLALHEVLLQVRDRMTSRLQRFAKGGLAALGRGGDTILAHINPMEAEVLRRMGGSGTINPNTGIREFKGGGVGEILSVVVPIAASIFAPGLGTAIGSALGISDALASSVVGNAIIGGVTGGLTGGSKGLLKGALLGGLSGGLGYAFGGDSAGAIAGAESAGPLFGAPSSSVSQSLVGPPTGAAAPATPGVSSISPVINPAIGIQSAPLLTPVGASPFMQTLGQLGERAIMGAKGLLQNTKPLSDYMTLGKGAYDVASGYQSYEKEKAQREMFEAYQRMIEQGVSPQDAAKQVMTIYSPSFGDYGGKLSNAFGQYSYYGGPL